LEQLNANGCKNWCNTQSQKVLAASIKDLDGKFADFARDLAHDSNKAIRTVQERCCSKEVDIIKT
jgi:TfoX/Sxy family transcriptional regulator of competence genes